MTDGPDVVRGLVALKFRLGHNGSSVIDPSRAKFALDAVQMFVNKGSALAAITQANEHGVEAALQGDKAACGVCSQLGHAAP